MTKYHAHLTGELGEAAACGYLRRKGYSIISKNYKSKIGELDIVAAKDRTLVFIEVKARSSEWMAKPYEFVDNRKQKKLRQLADGFLAYSGVDKLGERFKDVRFDVVSVNMNGSGEAINIEHIKDAFE